jgi:hypothetical protein
MELSFALRRQCRRHLGILAFAKMVIKDFPWRAM